MLWILVILVALACCVSLFIASRRAVAVPETDAARAFYRSQIEGIEQDIALGRISEAEAGAARAEIAREVVRLDRQAATPRTSGRAKAVLLAVPVVAVASVALYALVGRSDLPAQPFAQREFAETGQGEPQIDIEDAIAQVEARLVETPNDIRGWQVLAPIYMQSGRYPEAANAYRRILLLAPVSADAETDLAEAIIMSNGGDIVDEAMTLLRSAADRDPEHVRSRFYLAGALTQDGDFAQAVEIWQYLLSIAAGDELWIGTARAGLAAAQAGETGATLAEPEPDQTQEVMIRGMVESLAARLYDTSGNLEEWRQLVRSRMVLDGEEAALADLERGLGELSGPDRAALADYGRELGLNTEQ